jgi:thioredoxin reductase (NADPH)
VEVIDDFAGEARGTMGVFRPDRFVGDLNMLTGQAVSL